jgi:regulator of RNase E activity RraA
LYKRQGESETPNRRVPGAERKVLMMKSETRDILRNTSTASIATMLFKRGLRNQYVQNVSRLNATAERMVGQAFTLRHIPAREDLNPISVFHDPGHPQRRAVEDIPTAHVLVMDCHQDASAASAGSILATRLQIRGCAGVVTDGGLRDAEEIARLDMPCFCNKPSAPTNLTMKLPPKPKAWSNMKLGSSRKWKRAARLSACIRPMKRRVLSLRPLWPKRVLRPHRPRTWRAP